MMKSLLALTLLTLALPVANAQEEGPTATQMLVSFASKTPASPTAKDVTIKVDNRTTNLLSLKPVPPNGTQIAILIDDGLRTAFGSEMNNVRNFLNNLPQGTEVFVGYMQNGRVVPAGDIAGFTTDRAAVGKSLHLPMGLRGASASPYFSPL